MWVGRGHSKPIRRQLLQFVGHVERTKLFVEKGILGDFTSKILGPGPPAFQNLWISFLKSIDFVCEINGFPFQSQWIPLSKINGLPYQSRWISLPKSMDPHRKSIDLRLKIDASLC